MKKIAAGLIAAALVCTALPVYAAEDAETSNMEAEDAVTEESGLLPDSLCLEESEAGEDLSDLTGWSIAAEQAQVPMTMAASSGNVVVVLDPGHDSTHTGASYGGLREETLNLKIAEYCKEELEEYGGVAVYMTRTTAACPYSGNSNSNDLAGRVNYAASVGATVYVSLHLNANNDTSVSGAQVYCPNTNYNSSISAEGFALADRIMEQLNALGLTNRGVYSVNSQSGTTYPDGSLADYYAVIRRSKLAGFPGIIVEHAFMSNTSDRNTYMSSDASLKALGVADATGIANYFNLYKGTISKINGVWVYEMNGVPDYTYTGVAKNENGWWYVENGVVNFNYNGFAENQYGKWYIENGKVTFQKQDIIKDTTGALGEKDAWYYVSGSKVQTSFTGLSNFRNSYGWWYIQDGKVDFTHNGVDNNKNGWCYVTDGKVLFG
ncbi:MAG: N-acetylmuramoyl-L-alanine amidase, partial [Bacteroidales bacterium]|nr:N-acetylmuramoyl-L-alanine amidase [Bacteroidales bacterium]